MQNNTASGSTILSAVTSDTNISKSFREAFQMAFRAEGFRELLRREETTAVGAGLTSDLSDYRGGS